MAALGYLDTILNALDATVRVPIKAAFEYATRELTLGGNTKADNFAWYRVTGTTHATANTEFSIVHGMNQAPVKLIPVVALNSTGGTLVPLVVSRVADSKRVYLKSSSTGAAFTAYLE